MKRAKAGRPGRKPKAGERVPLGLRVTPQIKKQLDAAARNSGRSQSQEAETRLERTFRDEDALLLSLDGMFGRKLAGLLLLLGRAVADIGPQAGYRSTGTLAGATDWPDVPMAFDAAQRAVNVILDSLRPDIVTEANEQERWETLQLSERLTRGWLTAVADATTGGDLGNMARPIRERLGAERVSVPPGPIAVVSLPLQTVEGASQAEGRIIDTHMGSHIAKRKPEDER
jgi:hypothetical protein